MPVDDDATLRRMLGEARTVAVVGHSDKPWRPSYTVAQYLRRAGYKVYPVNPHCDGTIDGVRFYPDLASLPERVDLVDVFRRAEHLPAVVAEAIAHGATVLWTQFDVVDHDAARKAEAAGLQVVMDRCIAVEHQRLRVV